MYDVRLCKVYNLITDDKLEILKAAFVNQNAVFEEVLDTYL